MTVCEEFAKSLHIDDEKLIAHLSEIAEVRIFEKEEIILHEGEISTFVPFLISGATRGFSADTHGKEITSCFNVNKMEPLVASIPLDAPAIVSIETVMPSQILCLPTKEIMNMLEADKSLLAYYNRLLNISLRTQVEIKNVLYTYSAMERYQWFLDRYPGLDGKISSKYIASFLNITPVSLSRLRSSLRAVNTK